MNEERAKRKLTAILSADIKGHNHLMEKGKLAIVHTLETYQEIVTEEIKCYCRRIVDYPRDNTLTEFLSVMDEVKSNVKIKWARKAKNVQKGDIKLIFNNPFQPTNGTCCRFLRTRTLIFEIGDYSSVGM